MRIYGKHKVEDYDAGIGPKSRFKCFSNSTLGIVTVGDITIASCGFRVLYTAVMILFSMLIFKYSGSDIIKGAASTRST